MGRNKKFTSVLSLALLLLMPVSCIQPVMAKQVVPDAESVSEEAVAQEEEKQTTNVLSYENTADQLSVKLTKESDFNPGSTADINLLKDDAYKDVVGNLKKSLEEKNDGYTVSLDTSLAAEVNVLDEDGNKKDAGEVSAKIFTDASALKDSVLYHQKDDQTWEEIQFKIAEDSSYIAFDAEKLGNFVFAKADLAKKEELKAESSDAEEPVTLTNTEISPLADTDAYAILYESGELVFQRGSTPDAGKGTVLKTYTGFETKTYTGYNGDYAPWHENSTSIKSVSFKDVIKPVSTAYWFCNCDKLADVDLTNLDTSAVTSMSSMFDNHLEELALGSNFSFKGNDALPASTWHGSRQDKDYISTELQSTYNGATMSDTYIRCLDIKFDAMGGKSSESKRSGYIGTDFDSLPTAEKKGYDFVGWFTEKTGGKQLLVNQPITQSTYYAQYTEHKYPITVTNDVAGTMGDKTKDFTYHMKLTGNTPAELPYTKGTETGTLKATDGVVEFTLSDGESITFGDILINTTYKITEVDGASNGYTVESTNSSGTLTEDTDVSFTNTRNGTVPTAAHTNILISIGVFATALAGLFWCLRKRNSNI